MINAMMIKAVEYGFIEIVKLCKEWGATNYDGVLLRAAFNGYIDIAKLCKEWGAKLFFAAIINATKMVTLK